MALFSLIGLTLVTGALSLLGDDVKVCPSPCTCEYEDNMTSRFTVDCTRKSLKALPDISSLENQTIFRAYFGYNNIEELSSEPFNGFSVEGVDLSYNPIKTISPNAFQGIESSLKYLSLRGTQLTAWPTDSIVRLGKLQTLHISDVFMASPVPLLPGSFAGLNHLEELVLSNNGLSNIDENAFNGLPSLNVLLVDENKLTAFPTAFSKLSNLVELSLENNRIPSLGPDSLEGLTKLKTLNMADNVLTRESLSRDVFLPVTHSLETLNLDFNALGDFSPVLLSHLKALKNLHLAATMLTMINGSAFDQVSNLNLLDLSDNDLNFTVNVGIEVFKGLEDSLETILLNRVQLTSIPVEHLSRLRKLNELHLAGNKIESLEGINQLKATFYDLEYNQINHIETTIFNGTKAPLSLKLNHNKLTNLTFIADVCMFRKLELSGNQIVCDCAVYNLLRASGPEVTGRCLSPRDVEGVKLQGLLFEQLMSDKCENQASSEPTICNFSSSAVVRTRSSSFYTLASCSLALVWTFVDLSFVGYMYS